MLKLYIPAILLLFLMSCQTKDITFIEIKEEIDSMTSVVRPDKRTDIFTIELKESNGQYILKGETDKIEKKSELIEHLKSKNYVFIDSITELPLPELGENIYGLVRLSVCNIRSNPKHSAELATQSLMGTVLRIFKKKGSWYYVQTPNNYLGWLDEAAIHFLTKEDMGEWMSAPKGMIRDLMIYSTDGEKTVSDLVTGNILILGEGRQAGMQQIIYPDGRIAWIPQSSIEPLSASKAKIHAASGETIITEAIRYLGTPYLWGGTSSKGFDCSGFTKTVYYLNGIQLERDASLQVHNGIHVETDKSLKNLEKGDLLFFGSLTENPEKPRVTHVAIYMGNGKIIHAAGEVKIESLYPNDPLFNEDRLSAFLSARRILGSTIEHGIPSLEELIYY